MKTEDISRLAANPTSENVGKLYTGLMPIVRHIAKGYARCRADIDEMSLDMSIVLLDCIEAHKSDGQASFKTYFIRAIHNKFGKFYRRNRPTATEDIDGVFIHKDPDMEDLWDCSSDDGSIAGHLASEAAAFSQSLSDEQRTFMLDLLNGASLPAVAEGLGITEESAREKLRRIVESILIDMQIQAPHLVGRIPEELAKRFSGGDKPLFAFSNGR